MALKGITVNTPPEDLPHIYAEDDAAIFQSIVGDDGVFTLGQQCKATVISNNKVRIADGVICVGGHFARMPYGDYEDVAIANGQSGKKRNDLIVAEFKTTGIGGIDTFALKTKQGVAGDSAVDPTVTQDNLYGGGKVREFPLYRVKIESLSIVAVEPMFTLINTLRELNSKLTVSTNDVIRFTTREGQNYPARGGCYYYKIGSKVHVHLGIQGLIANTVYTVYVLPPEVHPESVIYCVGNGGEFAHICRLEIARDGGLNLISQDSYAGCDVEYDVY